MKGNKAGEKITHYRDWGEYFQVQQQIRKEKFENRKEIKLRNKYAVRWREVLERREDLNRSGDKKERIRRVSNIKQQTETERKEAIRQSRVRDDERRYRPPEDEFEFDLADWEFEQDDWDSYEEAEKEAAYEEAKENARDKWERKQYEKRQQEGIRKRTENIYAHGDKLSYDKRKAVEQWKKERPTMYHHGDYVSHVIREKQKERRRDKTVQSPEERVRAVRDARIKDATREYVDESDTTKLKRDERQLESHRSYVYNQGIRPKEKWKPTKRKYGFLRTVIDHAKPMDVTIEREGDARKNRRADFVRRREEYTKGLNWFQKWIVPRPLLEFFGAPPPPKPGYDTDAPVTKGGEDYYREYQVDREYYGVDEDFDLDTEPDESRIIQAADNPDVQRLLEKYEDNSYTNWNEFDEIFLSAAEDFSVGLVKMFKYGVIPLGIEGTSKMNAIINTGDNSLLKETLKNVISIERFDYYVKGFITGDWGGE